MTTATCLVFYLPIILPKIEAYSQRPAIAFYKSLKGKEAYVTTVDFKSYAPYFYFEQPNDPNPNRKDIHWLLTGNIDKPAYFVLKVTDTLKMATYQAITLMKTEGGFAFYQRGVSE